MSVESAEHPQPTTPATTAAPAGAAPAAEAGSVIVELATLPPGATVDEAALARILGRSKRTIQVAVSRGDLPPGFLFLGRRTWLVGALVKHLEAMQEAALKAAARRDAKRPKEVFQS